MPQRACGDATDALLVWRVQSREGSSKDCQLYTKKPPKKFPPREFFKSNPRYLYKSRSRSRPWFSRKLLQRSATSRRTYNRARSPRNFHNVEDEVRMKAQKKRATKHPLLGLLASLNEAMKFKARCEKIELGGKVDYDDIVLTALAGKGSASAAIKEFNRSDEERLDTKAKAKGPGLPGRRIWARRSARRGDWTRRRRRK